MDQSFVDQGLPPTEDSDLATLFAHPNFCEFRPVISQALNLPENLLRELLRLKTSPDWPRRRALIRQRCQMPLIDPEAWRHAFNDSTELHSDSMYNSNMANTSIGPLGSPIPMSTSLPHRPSQRQRPPAHRARGSVPKYVYQCGYSSCRGKIYKKQGQFKNHMHLSHNLTEIDTMMYLKPAFTSPLHPPPINTNTDRTFAEATHYSPSSYGSSSQQWGGQGDLHHGRQNLPLGHAGMPPPRPATGPLQSSYSALSDGQSDASSFHSQRHATSLRWSGEPVIGSTSIESRHLYVNNVPDLSSHSFFDPS